MDKSQEPSHPAETRGHPQRSRAPLPGEEFCDTLGAKGPETRPTPSATAGPASDQDARWRAGDTGPQVRVGIR